MDTVPAGSLDVGGGGGGAEDGHEGLGAELPLAAQSLQELVAVVGSETQVDQEHVPILSMQLLEEGVR